MASENELQIVLTLIDNASSELKKITGDVKKDTQDIAKESDKASKSIKDGFKDAGKELHDFRKAAFAVTAEIAFIGAAVKAWGEHNIETKDSLNSLSTNSKNLFAMFGSIFAPAIRSLSKALEDSMGIFRSMFKTLQDGYTKAFETISFGIQYLVSFTSALRAGSSMANAHKIALDQATESVKKMSEEFRSTFTENIPQISEIKNKIQEMNEAMQNLNMQYIAGSISAQQYYSILTGGNLANFQNMQTQMSLMQQMAQQENIMRNQSLMDYTEDIQSRMGLLKTLQDYHHTAYSSMMDFANMFIQKFSTGMTTALTSIIMGTKKAGEAFKEFGLALIQSIVEFVIQYGIQMLIASLISKMVIASTVAQANALAMAWLPAATFASIATLGGADAAGIAGLSAATGAAFAIGTAAMLASKAAGAGAGGGAGGAYAEGGWVGLNGPEVALLGERGPEYVIPNHQLGGFGNQTSIHIEINNPQVRSDEDIKTLAEEVSQILARETERL